MRVLPSSTTPRDPRDVKTVIEVNGREVLLIEQALRKQSASRFDGNVDLWQSFEDLRSAQKLGFLKDNGQYLSSDED